MVRIRLEGKGSFLNSGSLKEFSREMIGRGHREFIVDLAHCPVMDSTFMGTLTGMAIQLREHQGGQLSIINLNESRIQFQDIPTISKKFSVLKYKHLVYKHAFKISCQTG